MSDCDTYTADTIVAFLADIFARRGGEEYLGEPVTMAEHMLQGAYFAQKNGERDVIIVATLLHDIGHFTSEFGMFSMNDTHDRLHEKAGATALEPFFPEIVTACVRHHVAAKRYLCAARPEYMKKLSAASLHSLHLQGGPMSADEVNDFESLPQVDDIIKVRYLDDQGKVAGMKTPDFAYFAPIVQGVVDDHCASLSAGLSA